MKEYGALSILKVIHFLNENEDIKHIPKTFHRSVFHFLKQGSLYIFRILPTSALYTQKLLDPVSGQ